VRLAIDFNLAASNVVNMATSPPTVTIKPFMTVATSASDTKPIRVRGPLINSSVGAGTYTVYVRPFFDEVDSLGTLTIFNDAKTVYTINGTTYVGAPGLTALSQTSAGTTMTAAYTSFVPTATLSTAVTAGEFKSTFVLAGSTLEDYYTQGLEGDVIARSGNTLTLRGSTLQLNDGTSQYNDAKRRGPGGTRHHRDGRRQYDPQRARLSFSVRRAAHRRPRHLSAAGFQGRDPGRQRLQHQHRNGAPPIDGAVGFARVLRGGKFAPESANHR